jgi:heat-inducible transcriptional repressor
MGDTIDLTDRRKKILRTVIQEYVRTAQPVSSNMCQSADLGVSPATIRNDLAALEALGLLTHPHTSAGRIPTDAGYRYFVHHLMADTELPPSERLSIRQEFHQARQEMDQWLQLSASVLARTSQSAALATAPRSLRSRYKHLELVAIYAAKVLLVLVMHDGMVKQQLLDLDQPMEQSELSMVSNELNDRLVGLNVDEIASLVAMLSPFARQVMLVVMEAMERVDSQISGQIYRDGLAQVLEAPEFAEGENVRRIVQVFERRSLIEQVVGELSDVGDVHVVIAGDGRLPELRDMSLVLGRYGVDEHATGVLGVIGPVRMAYGRSVGAVRFVAAVMSEMVEGMYGPTYGS